MLTTGATGLPQGVVDTRIANVYHLKNGPYPLTPSVAYDDYAGSPVHRFLPDVAAIGLQRQECHHQQSQRLPCGSVPWVETTIGTGGNGEPRPNPFTDETTGEGAISMQFFNVQQGDAPYLTYLAQTYTLSDNMHQAVMGGTGANHIMLGSGTGFATPTEKATSPCHQPTRSRIRTRNPGPTTGTRKTATAEAATATAQIIPQPGVKQVFRLLGSLPYRTSTAICQSGAYYC